MKSLPHVSSLILFLSFWSCGQPSGLTHNSHVHEAPDAINAYQRMGLDTKPYTDVRATAQINSPQKFWSGFYWPTYQGGISYRWQYGGQTESYTAYLYPIPSFPEYQQLRPEQLQRLSPAEKYDVWVNDPAMTLTRIERQKVINTAQNYNNTIPTWFGICDGWALATSMEDEPIRMVRAQSPSGQIVPFYPEDIKALMSQYYAHARKQYVSAGGRCNRPQVTKDANGRVIEPECRDINPATLHLAMDRFVGDKERKLIIDISRDEMVWNYPIYNYRIQYNNLRRFTPHPSYPHAAPGTQYLINVNATVVLVSGDQPTTQLVPQRAYLQKVWQYVLELDGSYNIIGGEWITDEHPDFVWIVQSAANGSSRIDYQNLSALAQAARSL
ncbi:hypothetical protein [Oligoflexus tunisiensis]|uniref:hypothetical protein n=1 Tax=Oligoflexus tunisiensis TaxID=708132 RepID=UPI00114C96A6|nr:hypothetical protein [Oligoflexus tunisiensis]